jgi:hypothetical protein
MKKAMSLLLMSFIGLVGTYAWAGSAREDSVARLQSAVRSARHYGDSGQRHS